MKGGSCWGLFLLMLFNSCKPQHQHSVSMAKEQIHKSLVFFPLCCSIKRGSWSFQTRPQKSGLLQVSSRWVWGPHRLCWTESGVKAGNSAWLSKLWSESHESAFQLGTFLQLRVTSRSLFVPRWLLSASCGWKLTTWRQAVENKNMKNLSEWEEWRTSLGLLWDCFRFFLQEQGPTPAPYHAGSRGFSPNIWHLPQPVSL